MKPRIDITKASREFRSVYQAILGVENAIKSGGLDAKLLDLVRVRASQMNGCAYCLDMHTKDLRAAGESEQRIYCLEAWREAPFYTDRERAALAWCEAVTDLHNGHVPDEVFNEARQQFSESELPFLTAAVAAINLWNRLAISTRAVPGEYQPPRHSKPAVEEAAAAAH